tara:strand:+ start:2008 stop:2400 length:393 start_codon:yes stop_codon:yes gene_type:complete
MRKTDNEMMTTGTLEERIARVVEGNMLTARELDGNTVEEYYLDLRELVADLLTEVKAQQKELDFQSSVNRYNGHILELYKNTKKDKVHIRIGYDHEHIAKQAKKRREGFSILEPIREATAKKVGKIDLNK